MTHHHAGSVQHFQTLQYATTVATLVNGAVLPELFVNHAGVQSTDYRWTFRHILKFLRDGFLPDDRNLLRQARGLPSSVVFIFSLVKPLVYEWRRSPLILKPIASEQIVGTNLSFRRILLPSCRDAALPSS